MCGWNILLKNVKNYLQIFIEGHTICKTQSSLNEIQTQVTFILFDHMPINLIIRPVVLRTTNCTENKTYPNSADRVSCA